MIETNRRHHNLPVVLFLTALLLLVPATTAGAAQGTDLRQVPAKICRIDWRRGTWFVRKLIRCAAFRYPVPGGASKALSIANRESRFHPRAYNASSGAMGIYQHLRRYWPKRSTHYGFHDWSAFNARANVIVAMRMVHNTGWGPWGG